MNILLFEPGEEAKPLPAFDPRARHLREILKVRPGQELRGGIVNGPSGIIVIKEILAGEVRFVWRPGKGGASSGNRPPRVTMLLGHPRPPVLRRLFKDLTTIGVDKIVVTHSELSEKSYLQSNIWGGKALRKALIEGASQAGVTTIPEVRRFYSLRRALEELASGSTSGAADDRPGAAHDDSRPADRALRLLLDPEASEGLYEASPGRGIDSALLAIGPERGWSDDERGELLKAGFTPVGLGRRTLRTETAALAGAAFLVWLLGMELGPGAKEKRQPGTPGEENHT